MANKELLEAEMVPSRIFFGIFRERGIFAVLVAF